jgi:hypothetical protein
MQTAQGAARNHTNYGTCSYPEYGICKRNIKYVLQKEGLLYFDSNGLQMVVYEMSETEFVVEFPIRNYDGVLVC